MIVQRWGGEVTDELQAYESSNSSIKFKFKMGR